MFVKQEKSEHILKVASQLFAEKGYEKMDVQQLADQIGIGKGTIYRYFFSKQELFLATADRVMRLLDQRMQEETQNLLDPIEKIAKAISSFFAFFEENPAFAELLVQDRAVFKERPRHTFFQYKEQVIEKWKSFFEMLIAQKIVREMEVEKIVDFLTSLLYGFLYVRFFTEKNESLTKQAQNALEIFFHGILQPQEKFL